MKHQQEILEKEYKDNQAKYNLALKLFENITNSNKNYIPKFNKKAEHDLIIKLPGISYIKEQKAFPKLSARYQLEWSLELGFASFLFLEQYFKIVLPKDIKNYEKFLINVRNTHQTKTKKYGNIYLVFSYAVRSSIIQANYRDKTNFNKVLIELIKRKLEEYEFEILHDLKYCIPYLDLSEDDIFQILENLKAQKKLDNRTLISFEDYLRNNQDQLQNVFNYFSKKDYPDILGYIYTINYNNSSKTLFIEKKFRKARLFAISRIKFIHSDDISKAIDIAEKNVKSNKILCIRILKNSIESNLSNIEQLHNAGKILKHILISSKEEQPEVFDWILSIDHENIANLVIELIEEDFDLIFKNLHRVSEYLWLNGRKNKKLKKVFYSIIQRNPKIDLNLFKNYITSLEKADRNYLCSWLLNNNDNQICSKVSDLFLISNSCLELNEEYLQTLRFYDLKYIANKIIAFIYSAENLTGLIFDLLKAGLDDKNLDMLVVDIFINYVLFNYHYPNEFLNEKIRNGSPKEKEIGKIILIENRIRLENYNNTEMIEEFKISGSRLREYNKMKFQNIPSTPSSDEFSITQLFQNIELKTGKSFTTRNEKGEYSKSAEMSEISSSYEMPKGEFLDPIGQHKLRIESINYRREK